MSTYIGKKNFTKTLKQVILSGPGRFEAQGLTNPLSRQIDPYFTNSSGFLKYQTILPNNISSISANPAYFDGYSDDVYETYVNSFLSEQFTSKKIQKLYTKYSRRFVVYYSMIARDGASATPTYRTWVTQGSPDPTASQYNGPKDGTISDFADIAIAAKWKVFID